MYPCAKVALSLESSNVRIFFDDVHVIYVCLFFQALICSRFLECIYWKYHYYQHPAYHGTPNSQGMMYWCLCISLQFYILPWIYPHGSISLWWQIMVFTYPVTLLIPNGQGLRLSTFWLSLRWEQKENHINNRSVEKNVGWTHLFAVGGWKLIVFLKWRSSFLLCFFGWAGLHGYTLFDGWYRYGIDGANWQKTYCNFLEVFFVLFCEKAAFGQIRTSQITGEFVDFWCPAKVEPKTSGLFLSRCSAHSSCIPEVSQGVVFVGPV